jgi:hypothetical protein
VKIQPQWVVTAGKQTDKHTPTTDIFLLPNYFSIALNHNVTLKKEAVRSLETSQQTFTGGSKTPDKDQHLATVKT